MKSRAERDRLATEHGIIAFEMEGAGLWDEVPCLVIKAVCDYADSHKNKGWQPFAAARAASAARALLSMEVFTTSNGGETGSGAGPARRLDFQVPYNPNRNFVGRASVLSEIKQEFGHVPWQDATAKPRSRIALHGLWGVGKTQIALAYAYWIDKAYPDMSVFWVHGSSSERFSQSFRHIAQKHRIPGFEDPKVDVLDLVKTWLLSPDRGRWILIIDNADDLDLAANTIVHNIPECPHGFVLITTRNRKAGLWLTQGGEPIRVPNMDDHEAHQLLNVLVPNQQISLGQASTLASRLEHLPLALAQAAAFIQLNSVTAQQYLGLLDDSDASLVQQLGEPFPAMGRDSHTPHAVTATWILSFRQIESQHHLASEILCLVSFFDRQAIPEEYINYYCKQRPEPPSMARVLEAIGTLLAYSFISKQSDSNLDVHRLVQLVTQKWLSDKGASETSTLASQALQIVTHHYPYGQYETRDACSKYLPHAYAILRMVQAESERDQIAEGSLRNCIGGYHIFEGAWDEAEKFHQSALSIRTKVLGADHPDTLASMNFLARTYWHQGRWVDAEKLGVKVMEMRKKTLGAGHLDTLLSMGYLAGTYRDLGRLEESEALGIEVVEARRLRLGPDHPETLNSINNLAFTLWEQGRWEESERLEVEVLETRRRTLGADHPDTIMTINNLASTYWKQGRLDEAERLEVEAMEAHRAKLGEDHPDTLLSMHNLAITWRSQGRNQEAYDLLLDCCHRRSRVIGASHPNTLASRAKLDSWQTTK